MITSCIQSTKALITGFVCLLRRGAAEVRKQVSSAYLGDLSKSSSGINISASAAAALQNVSLMKKLLNVDGP